MAVRVATHQPAQAQRADPRRLTSRGAPHGVGFSLPSRIHHLQRAVGNRAMNSLLRSRIIQPKLTVSHPDDQHEREADRVAGEVMRMPEPQPGSTVQRSPIGIQRSCEKCEAELKRKPILDKDDEVVQAKFADNSAGFEVSGGLESYLNASRGAGQRLPSSSRSYFEPRFGQDLRDVRIHTDGQASQAANSISAKAFTSGKDIVFGAGQYAPQTHQGQTLLAHELTHTIQQTGGQQRAPETTNGPQTQQHIGRKGLSTQRLGANRSTVHASLPAIQRAPKGDPPPSPVTKPKPTSCPPASGSPAGTLAEYIDLIRCAETTTGYSPREMLAMLRQLYYGEAWSATSQDPKWKYVIPCSPSLGNPKGKLGDALYQALHDSDTVEGTDLGHVFTGLEAMTCPASSVTLEKTKWGVGIKLTVDLSNEAFATWGGDLGATAGAMVACWMMTNDERAKATKDCHQGNTPQGLEYYFLKLQAPSHDLEGDIAPFAMRASEAGLPCGSSLEKQYTPKAPISSVFQDFFHDKGPAGKTRKDRYSCFAESIGAKVVNGKITNRADLIAKYDTKVMSFAWAYYVNLKKEIPRSDPTAQLLLKHSVGTLKLFFGWLEARMQP
jgi:Domain of unknown function (DUF4157)